MPRIELILRLILAMPYVGGYMKLDADACNIQTSCALLQKQLNETIKPIECWSYSLTNAEKRCGTI